MPRTNVAAKNNFPDDYSHMNIGRQYPDIGRARLRQIRVALPSDNRS